MSKFLLKLLSLPLIIIDWSPLTDGQSQQLLKGCTACWWKGNYFIWGSSSR